MSEWSDDQIATLRHMHAEGHSFSVIAATLGGGMSRNAVIGKAHRLKLDGRPVRRRVAKAPKPKKLRFARKKYAGELTALRDLQKALPRRIAEPATPPDCTPVTLLNLEHGHCRFPIGEVCGPDTLFCGAPKGDGDVAYCPYHRRISTGEGTPSERRASRDAKVAA